MDIEEKATHSSRQATHLSQGSVSLALFPSERELAPLLFQSLWGPAHFVERDIPACSAKPTSPSWAANKN